MLVTFRIFSYINHIVYLLEYIGKECLINFKCKELVKVHFTNIVDIFICIFYFTLLTLYGAFGRINKLELLQ